MDFFKKPYKIRRYSAPVYVKGYASIPYKDFMFLMDVQTTEDVVKTAQDGSQAVQKLKVFCDSEIFVESEVQQQKADRLFFHGKWFECRSCRLSENTPLRHYTATFVECPDQDSPPNGGEVP